LYPTQQSRCKKKAAQAAKLLRLLREGAH
jgi:hypothetical protein